MVVALYILALIVAASALTCQHTICNTETESCCDDPKHGAVCCIKQLTGCCPPTNGTIQLPSRCCPLWSECCDSPLSRDGCCNPLFGEEKALPVSPASSSTDESESVFALFDITSILSDTEQLKTYSLNPESAAVESSLTVKGFDNHSEMSREWIFDSKRKVFYLVQANFTLQEPSLKTHLFTVDATTGKWTARLISNAKGLVTGFAYSAAEDVIVFANYKLDENGQKVGYNFYQVKNLDSEKPLVGVRVSSSTFSSPGEDNWAGYFNQLVGNDVFRVGFQDVLNSKKPCLQITRVLSTQSAEANSTTYPIYFGFNLQSFFPGTGKVISTGANSYRVIALAAQVDSASVVLVDWTVGDKEPSILHTFSNGEETPFFGPLAGTLSPENSHYFAFVVQDSYISTNLDTWDLASCDLSSGGGCTQKPISPWILAAIDAQAALGVA